MNDVKLALMNSKEFVKKCIGLFVVSIFLYSCFCSISYAEMTYAYIGNPLRHIEGMAAGNIEANITFDDTVTENFSGHVYAGNVVSAKIWSGIHMFEYPNASGIEIDFLITNGAVEKAKFVMGNPPELTIVTINMPQELPMDEIWGNGIYGDSLFNPGVWYAVKNDIKTKNLGDAICTGTGVGNPVNSGTGNKFQSEIDYAGGTNNYIKLIRFYNSQSTAVTSFGKSWNSIYDRHLVVSSYIIMATRPDGRMDKFHLNTSSGLWDADKDVTSKLISVADGWKLTDINDTVENYSPAGRLLSIADRAGNKETLNYDSQNILNNVTDTFGNKIIFAYDSMGRIVSVTIPDGGIYSYAYDAKDNLTSVTYPDGKIRQYIYESSSFPNALTGIMDENGNRFSTFVYDTMGRATSTEHANGVVKNSLTYNVDGTVTVADALGNTRDYTYTTQYDLVKPAIISNQGCSCGAQGYTYDANGFLASKTDFNGVVTTYTRDARGLELIRTEASGTPQARTISTTWHSTYHLPLVVTEPNRTTSFTYDAKGNVLTKTVTADSLTRTWTYTYNANGQVLTATDPNGHATTKTYNATGGVATITNALGQVTSIPSYDANGRPLTIQDPNGLTTTLTYDARGNLTSRTAGTEVTTYAYDAVGQLTRVTQPDGSYIASAYDPAHRLTGISDNLGNRIAYTLDAMSNRIKEEVFDPTNHLAQTRAHVYDSLNRLAQDIGAQNQTTTYGHDGNGNLTSVTDPLNHVTHNNFDALNRLIQSTDPTSAVTHVAYNANDLTTGVTDPRGLATAYVYDGLGNRTSTQSPDTGTTTKTFDAAGNVLTSTDARGMTTTFTYDALNRPTSAAFADGKTITYTYDQGANGKGRLTSMTDPSGTTTWTYDLHGRVLTKQQKTGAVTLTTIYTYDSATGKPSTVTYPSGRQINYTYDTVSKKLAGIKVGNTSLISALAYQPFGPVASWTQGNGKTYGRTFDLDGRLVGIAIGGSTPETVTLTYDAAGRITGINDSAAKPKIGNTRTTDFQYAATNNRQTGSTGGAAKTYTYDAAGNITGDGVATFAYDGRGRLAQASKGGTTTYAINGLGQRVAKSGSGADGGTVYFVYDEAGHLLGEYDASGHVIEETVWLGDLPVGVLKTGAQYYVNPDHLGAPLSITDAGGKVVWRWDRDPYGNGKPNENPSGLGTFTYNLRLPGQYYDKETELHCNYFRDYNPKTGRYVQSDPIGMSGGLNTYAYVAGNPTGVVDKKGLDWNVVLYEGGPGNPFYHVGLGVAQPGMSTQTIGYYASPLSSLWQKLEGTQSAWMTDTATRTDTITIRTNPWQDLLIENYIQNAITHPSSYRLRSNTCATQVGNALGAGGINVGSTIFPKDLIEELQTLQPYTPIPQSSLAITPIPQL